MKKKKLGMSQVKFVYEVMTNATAKQIDMAVCRANRLLEEGGTWIKKKKFAIVLPKNYPFHISVNMSAKMDGMPSFSTSCKDCERCKNNIAAGKYYEEVTGGMHICAHCFSVDTQDHYSALQKNCIENGELLRKEVYTGPQPVIFAKKMRIESFGDIANVTQCINYHLLIQYNPGVHFAWWTKNPDIYKRYVDTYLNGIQYRDPNCRMVLSSPVVDRPAAYQFKVYREYFDSLFTVFSTPETALPYGGINCGAKSCFTCNNDCYHRDGGQTKNELLKSAQKRNSKVNG